MANRNIRIIYTKESGRPDLYTTESNLPQQDKFFRNIIKEVYLVDEKKTIPLPEKEVVKEESPLIIKEEPATFKEVGHQKPVKDPSYQQEIMVKHYVKEFIHNEFLDFKNFIAERETIKTVEKEVIKEVEKEVIVYVDRPLTDEQVVAALLLRGKSPGSIAKYLAPTKKERLEDFQRTVYDAKEFNEK